MSYSSSGKASPNQEFALLCVKRARIVGDHCVEKRSGPLQVVRAFCSQRPEKFLQQVLRDSLAILAGGASIVDWGDFGEKCAAAFFDQRRPDLFAREQPFHLTAAKRNRGDASERDSRFDNASVFH